MTSKIIKREFDLQTASAGFTPVQWNPSPTGPLIQYYWSNFMQTYAVQDTAQVGNLSFVTSYRYSIQTTIELQKGNYFVTGAADSQGTVVINGQAITLYGPSDNLSRETVGTNTVVWHPGGKMTIVLQIIKNQGYQGMQAVQRAPDGIAVTISEYRQNVTPISAVDQFKYGTGEQVRYGDPYVGPVVWSTRSPSVGETGRFAVTMPFKASITAYAWGAGGGGGGMDAGTLGGIGSPGLYNTASFSVNPGDYLEVFVGTGGRGGQSNAGGAAGGSGGKSRISIEGNNEYSFNGGAGSAAGPSPSSGAGGGGGGASGVLVNNQRVLVAGGGGGGGGAGNDGNGSSQYQRRDASIDNNANGVSGSDYRGENGQPKGGDGGGAGGGGGGYPGGRGGAVAEGDASGHAGQCGGNFPNIVSPSTGQNSEFYKPGYAGGGDRGGGNGQNGRVVLVFEPISLMAVKTLGFWKQVDEAFIKVNDTWADIDAVFIKSNDVWRPINDAGQGDVALTPFTADYGSSARDFS